MFDFAYLANWNGQLLAPKLDGIFLGNIYPTYPVCVISLVYDAAITVSEVLGT